MAFSNPTFEQRRAQVLGKTTQPQQQVQPVTNQGGFSNPAFEQRRVQVTQQQQQPKKTQTQSNTSVPIRPSQQSVYKRIQNDLTARIISAGSNVVKQAKRIDFDRIKNAIVKEAKVYTSEEGRIRRKEAFISGAKIVPLQLTIGASIIADSIAKQQTSYEDYFNFLPKPFKASAQKNLLGKLFKKEVEKVTSKIREKATEEQKRAVEPYAKLGEAQTPGQKIAEALMLNLPQIATSTGLTLATALVTKNPLLARTVGMSTSYGLGASEVYNQARQNELSDKDALPLSMIGGAVIGALDFAPLNRLIGKTGASKQIQKSIVNKIASGIVSTGIQSGFEGLTEGMQEIVGNAVESTYNENTELFKNVGLSSIVGAIFGGFSDVGLSSIVGAKNALSVEKAGGDVSAKIEEALQTPEEERTPEQVLIVENVLTQEVTPDQAYQIVQDQNLAETEEGKQIVKTVLQAKQQDKDVRIVTNEENDIESVEVVDKEYKPVTQQSKEKSAKKPKEKVIVKGKIQEKPQAKVFNTKESRVIQEAVTSQLEKINQTAKSAEEVTERMKPAIETAIKNAKGEKYALSGIKTAIKKQMYSLAGISEGENYKFAYKQLKLAQREDPEIGALLTYIEQTIEEIDNDLISAKPRKAYKGEKLSKGIKEGENVTQKPIGEGKKKKSRLAVGVEQKAVEKGILENLSDLPQYKTVNMKDQARLALELLATDRARAVRVALGQENPPSNLLPESVFVAVENEALSDGNVELLKQLATSQRTTEATAMGQRIRALAERNPDSSVSIMRQLVDLRMQAFENKSKRKFDAVVKEQAKIVNKKLSLEERKIRSAQSIINALTC